MAEPTLTPLEDTTPVIGGIDDDKLIGGIDDDKLIGGIDDDKLIGGIDDDKLIGGIDDKCMFAKLFNVPQPNLVERKDESNPLPDEPTDETVYEVSFPMKLETLLTAIIVCMVATTMIVSYSPTLFVSVTLVITVIAVISLYFVNPMYAMTVLKRIMICTHMSSILLL
jgi:hypothetical protein